MVANVRAANVGATKPGRCASITPSFSVTVVTKVPRCSPSGELERAVLAGAARCHARAEADEEAGADDEGAAGGDLHGWPAAHHEQVGDWPEQQPEDEGKIAGQANALDETPDDTADPGDPPVEKQKHDSRCADQYAAEQRWEIRAHSPCPAQKMS